MSELTYEDYKKIYESKKGTVQDALDMIHSGDVIAIRRMCA